MIMGKDPKYPQGLTAADIEVLKFDQFPVLAEFTSR
jgi:hypothetical protein